MNTKKIASFVLATAALLAFAQPALALDFSKMKVKVSTSINKDCMISDGYDPVWSCFINDFKKVAGQEALVPTPTIYIRPDVPASLLSYAFLTSVGQYVSMPYSDQELAMTFNPVPNQRGFQDVRRSAASTFAYWASGGSIAPAKLDFFRAALSR